MSCSYQEDTSFHKIVMLTDMDTYNIDFNIQQAIKDAESSGYRLVSTSTLSGNAARGDAIYMFFIRDRIAKELYENPNT